MKRIYNKIIIYSLGLFTLLSFLFFIALTDIKKADKIALFSLNNAVNPSVNVYPNNIRVNWSSINSNLHFIIAPEIRYDNKAYLNLARGISNGQYNVNIASYLFSQYQKDYASFDEIIAKFDNTQRFYMIIHGTKDEIVQYVINHETIFKGIIFLDGKTNLDIPSSIDILSIYTDEIYKSDHLNAQNYYLENGLFDGFINVEGYQNTNMSWQVQQSLTIQAIYNFIEEEN